METRKLNLFIVDNNEFGARKLQEYLDSKFSDHLNISVFSDGKSGLEKVDRDTDMVILDNSMEGNKGVDILKAIKNANAATQVIMLSDNEQMAEAIEAYQAGAKTVVVKGPGSWKKITVLVTRIVTAPIRFIVRELDISSRLAVFIMSFLTIAFIVVMWAIIWHKF